MLLMSEISEILSALSRYSQIQNFLWNKCSLEASNNCVV